MSQSYPRNDLLEAAITFVGRLDGSVDAYVKVPEIIIMGGCANTGDPVDVSS